MQQKRADLRKDTNVAQEDRRAKMKEINDAATEKLKDILTADQLEKWKKLLQPGPRRPGGPGGPGGPPPGGDNNKQQQQQQ